MIHLSYYGLKYNPFDKDNDVYIETTDTKEMMQRLNYLKETKGLGLYTGPPGVGKTFAMKRFVKSLNPNLYRVCYVSMSTVTVMDFYRLLARGLGLEAAHRKCDLFTQIQARIEDLHDKQRITPVIILDEAQHLKHGVLQDITMLLNFEMDSKKNCILILAGLPHLAETMSRAVLEPLRQRIVSNYQIMGLEDEEVKSYIESKLHEAGRKTPLFEAGALSALIQNVQGNARRLNSIITQCLIIGQLKNVMTIDAETVFQANSELMVG